MLRAMAFPPTSIKGVLLREGHVLLLLNERGEWDLPGGRPQSGEDPREALRREVREETGLRVDVGEALDAHLFEVLPGKFVRIMPFACRVTGLDEVALSAEHLKANWLPIGKLADVIDGHRLPACYRAAIVQAISQPRSSNERVV